MGDEWDQFPEVEAPTAGFEQFPEVGAEMPSQQQTQQPTTRSRAAEVWDKIRGVGFSDIAAGVAEPALQLATGSVGAGVAGYAGAGHGLLNKFVGAGQWTQGTGAPEQKAISGEPADTVRKVQDSLTYLPKTEAGQAVSKTISVPFEKFDEGIDYVAEMAGDPEDTLGATMAYTAMAFLPAVLGRYRPTKSGKSGKSDKSVEKDTSVEADLLRQADELKKESSALYKEADNAGVAIKAGSYDTMLGRVRKKLAEEGFDKKLNPDTYAALQRLEQDAGKNLTLKGADINRRVVGQARGAVKPADARMAGEIMDIFDNWMGGFSKGDLISGDPAVAASVLPKARKLWSQATKSEELQWMVQRAGERAGQFTGSGFQNALVTEFRALAMNKKRLRRFSPEEQKAIQRVSRGDGLTNVMRYIGKFAPRGPISTAVGAGGGLAMFGPAGPALVMGAGEMGRQIATARTIGNVKKAADVVGGRGER